MAYKRVSPMPVAEGGLGANSFTAYSVICGGTTSTGAFQNVSGVGSSGNILTSNGAASLPSWQAPAASSISITGNSGGALTGSSFTFTGGTSGAVFAGSGTTLTESFNFLALPDTNSGATTGYISLGGVINFSNFGTQNIFVGPSSGNGTTTSTGSAALGYQALTALTSGTVNVGIGYQALKAVTSAGSNIGIGHLSLSLLTTGSGNNIAIGETPLASLTTGSFNIALGNSAGGSLASSESSNIFISNGGVIGDNNTIRIGAQGSTAGLQNKCFIAGITGVTTSNSNMVTINTSTGQLGAATIPTSSISITGDTGGALTGASFTFAGGTTGLSFGGSGSTETLTFAGITANAGTVNLGTDNAANAINIGLGTTARAIHIGDSAAAHVVTLGSTTGASSTTQRVGTGNYSLDGVAGSTYTVGASTTTGTIAIGGTAQTGTMTLGSSSGTNIVAIGAGEGATTVNIAGGATSAKTVNIARGAVANAVNIGSTNTTATTVISSGSGNVTVNTGLAINANGLNFNTKQSAFVAYLSTSTSNNVTGDATVYKIAFNTKSFDQNTDFNTSTFTFTAPVTGRYYFNVATIFLNVVAQTTVQIQIQATANTYNGSYTSGAGVVAAGGFLGSNHSCFTTMTAGDTCFVNAIASGSTKTVGIDGGFNFTYFGGHLVC